MNTPPDFDPSSFDDRVRSVFDADDHGADASAPAPSIRVWQGLQPHLLPPTPAAPRRAPWLAGFAGLLLGIVLMWMLFPPTSPARFTGKAPAQLAMAQAPPKKGGNPAPTPKPSPYLGGARPFLGGALGSAAKTPPDLGGASPKKGDGRPYLGGASGSDPKTSSYLGSAPGFDQGFPGSDQGFSGSDQGFPGLNPVALGSDPETPAIPTVLVPLVGTEQTLTTLGPDTTRTTRERRRETLLMQRAALVRLQVRADSLLLAVGELPTAPAVAEEAAPVEPLKNRWSVALSFAPERNFFSLGAPAADTLAALRRTHEQGRAGYNAALLAEYRLDRRLSVGAGVGVTSYGAELRLTDYRTTVTTKVDTITNTSTVFDTVTTRAWAIRRVRDSVLAPIVNFDNQIIGYQYLPTTRLDTVWTNLVNTQAVTTTTQIYKPTVTTRQETSARILRPNYRFLTVPLVLRYRLGRATDWASSPTAPRWWADVAVGTQLQFFLGGTQLTTRDGLTYQTARIGARGGPFRPLSIALTGALELNYALTPRLSASLAPTIRYQLESVYKASTNLTQKPTATGVQLGLRYAF